MTAFNSKKLDSHSNLGEDLKKRREEMDFSLEQVGREINVASKYLGALEKGDYQKLPGDIYVRNFIKSYTHFLKLDSEKFLEQYADEQAISQAVSSRCQTAEHWFKIFARRFFGWITPTIIRRLAFAGVIFIILGYLGFKAMAFMETPKLVIDSPQDNIQIDQPTIIVNGSTEPETTVTINDQQINVDESGKFSKDVALQDGVNSIKIVASKGLCTQTDDPNKVTTVYRTVVKNVSKEENTNLEAAEPANINK
jgi:cytoskeletal protein RodZ